MSRTKKQVNVSVLNWMGTIILTAIPGVSLIVIFLTLIFAKSPSKRSFAWALLLLTALTAVAIVALLALFPVQAAQLADTLEAYARG